MGNLYAAHGGESMTPAQLAGLQSLIVADAAGGPLTAGELGALHASPKLRAWLLPHLGGYGHYALHALLEGREPVGLAEYLGAMREQIASVVHS